MSDPDLTLDAIRALVAGHDAISAEEESAATAYLAASAALSARTFSDREHRQCVIDKDAAEARFLRSRADLRQRPHEDGPIEIMRHLLDVVGRQREMLAKHQFREAPGWDDGGPVVCIECTGGEGQEAPDCALFALLRETA